LSAWLKTKPNLWLINYQVRN